MKHLCLIGTMAANLWLLALTFPAFAQSPLVSMDSRDAPSAQSDAKRSEQSISSQAVPFYVIAPLPAPTAAEGLLAKGTSEDGRKSLSYGRTPSRLGVDGRLTAPPGADTIRVRVTSSGAMHLRTAWRFADDAEYEVTILAGANSDLPLTNRTGPMKGSDPRVVWSAITNGESQEALIRRIRSSDSGWSLSLDLVAHFDEGLQPPPQPSITPKSFGDSAYCQRDVACVLDAADQVDTRLRPAILAMTRAVAIMFTTTQNGSSFSCTGTLLNSVNYPIPLFLTAYHCMVGAVTLDTLWFYSRTNCGFGSPSPATQITGGSVTVWSSAALDSELLVLRETPPQGASYAGWNANSVPINELMVAIHHPRADVKKGSFGTVIGNNLQPILFSGLGTFPANTFNVVDWEIGIVEHGSSGSGLFTLDSTNPFIFRLRGTLTGGNATCSTIASRTYYSRLYNIYPYISSALNVPIAPPNPIAVEYFHSGFGHYFVTTIADEIAKLDNGTFVGWARTGQSFNVYPLGTTSTSSVCRFFTVAFAPKSSHFYTPSSSECATVKNNPNWKYEALVFAFGAPSATGACGTGTQPLYRLYNNGKSGAPNHRYTTSSSIRSTMIGQGWVPEGNGTLGVIGCVPV